MTASMRPNHITIHCTATPDGKYCDISTIEKWHMKRGFNMVGYHIVIQPDGVVQLGRPLNMKGAHVAGENDHNIGIAMVGTQLFSWEQFDALHNQLHGLQQSYDIKPSEFWCHKQFRSAIMQGKTCPGMDIQRLVYWYCTGDKEAVERYILHRG